MRRKIKRDWYFIYYLGVMPKVSVLMPNYNGEKYIGEAIESILNQTFTDFEFIIIDDGSTDRSWEIIQNYAAKDKRIVALRNDKNSGVGYIRNRLIKESHAEYLLWQDSDDVAFPDRIQLQYDFMESHPKVWSSGGTLFFRDWEKIFSKRIYSWDDAFLKRKIFRQSPVALPWSIMRRNIALQAGRFDENLIVAEDLDLSFRIGLISNFWNIKNPVIKYRNMGTGLTATKLKNMELKTIGLRLKYDGFWPYRMFLSDHLYTILQYISIFLLPAKFKIWIFNFLRNK